MILPKFFDRIIWFFFFLIKAHFNDFFLQIYCFYFLLLSWSNSNWKCNFLMTSLLLFNKGFYYLLISVFLRYALFSSTFIDTIALYFSSAKV